MRATKPAKPYKDFPLTAHPNGTWCKKIKGKVYHFGGWANPDAALAKYRHDVDDLQAGNVPEPMATEGQMTLYDLCDDFLETKSKLKDIEKLSQRMLFDYVKSCKRVCDILGKTRIVETLRPKDFDNLFFQMAKGADGQTVSAVTLANRVRTARVLFKYAADQDLIPVRLKFGQNFKLPGKDELREARTKAGKKMFESSELQQIVKILSGQDVTLDILDDKTGKPIVAIGRQNPVLRAMVLLGINAGFGQSDCATLKLSAVDLEKGWVDFPRPKTHVERRCPLWPETVDAIRKAIQKRPSPRDEQFSQLVFLTSHGQPFVRIGTEGAALDAIAGEFDKVRGKLRLSGRRTAFYSLRRTFETIAGNCQDQIAVDLVMGHAAASNDMGHVYRQQINDDRLQAVTDHVRVWLWPDVVAKESKAKTMKKSKAKNS